MAAKTKDELLALAAKHTEEQGCAAFVERAGKGMMLAYGSDTDIARLLQFPLDSPPPAPQPDGDALRATDLRHLIVMDAQFAWRGSTELRAEEIERLSDRKWVQEGHENGEFEITNAGREAINRALSTRPSAAAAVPNNSIEALLDEWQMLIGHPDTGTVMRLTLENVVTKLRHMLATAPAAPKGDPLVLPAGWYTFVHDCAQAAGGMVNGNRLSAKAKALIDALATPRAEQDSRSRLRRVAIEKGEPAPRFDEQGGQETQP